MTRAKMCFDDVDLSNQPRTIATFGSVVFCCCWLFFLLFFFFHSFFSLSSIPWPRLAETIVCWYCWYCWSVVCGTVDPQPVHPLCKIGWDDLYQLEEWVRAAVNRRPRWGESSVLRTWSEVSHTRYSHTMNIIIICIYISHFPSDYFQPNRAIATWSWGAQCYEKLPSLLPRAMYIIHLAGTTGSLIMDILSSFF